jgi:hypothetical protein
LAEVHAGGYLTRIQRPHHTTRRIAHHTIGEATTRMLGGD